MFSGTNLLTSCNGARCMFFAIFGFRKVSKEILSEWTGQTSKSITFHGEQEIQRGDREVGQGGQTPLGAARGGPAPG